MEHTSGIFQGFKVTPKMAIKFTKLTVYLTCIWPPKIYSKKRTTEILFEIFMYFSILLSIALLFPLIISIYKYSDDTFTVMKSSILISGIINFLIKIIIVRVYRENFQKIDLELCAYLKNPDNDAMIVLQKYIDKCWKFQGYMTCSYYLVSIGVIAGPLFLPQKFPCEAVYPFPVESSIISIIVYIHQSVVGFQCSAAMALDCQAALFLWYICARFEVLAKKSRDVHDCKDICSYIKEHQKILSSANQLTEPVRLIFLTTVFMTKIGMVFGGLMLVSDQPLTVKLQFAVLVTSAVVSIFVCVWPTEKLINVSSDLITHNIFYTSLTHQPAMRKLWLMIIRRAQTPLVIKVDGFMDSLSYQFYSSFLSTVFSYFTALRVAVQS